MVLEAKDRGELCPLSPVTPTTAAERSLLSKEALGGGGLPRARKLLQDFAAHAAELILFLQHVEAVQVHASVSHRARIFFPLWRHCIQ